MTEALKCRCQRLGIRWTNDAISGAFRLVGSNHPLVTPAPRARVDDPPPPILSRLETEALYHAVVAAFGLRAFKALPRRGFSRLVIDDTRTDDVVDVESIVAGGR